jgi:hypothetical protein
LGLSDFASVFSRSFVVGFFAPSFFGLFAARILVDRRMLPHALRAAGPSGQVVALGGVALLLGLLLSGLNRPLVRIFAGYPLKASKRPPFRWLARRRMDRSLTAFDELTRRREGPKSDARTEAAQRLDRDYPAHRNQVLPTALGNVIRSSETYPRSRYNLDGVTVWPRVELLLTDGERTVISDAQADLSFFVNSSVAVLAVGCAVIASAAWYAPTVGSLISRTAVALLLAALISWMAYRAAVQAAAGWGDSIRAGFDVHRLDVYTKLGIRIPGSWEDEKETATAVNRCLVYGEPVEMRFRAPAPDGPLAPKTNSTTSGDDAVGLNI